MFVLNVRNVHEALPRALKLLDDEGVQRNSRNGPVLIAPWPVTTIYERPIERVLFWPERDCNPFFHCYEALWMLAGRNDIAGPSRYAKNMANYSDDGVTLHAAYGYRWRRQFDLEFGKWTYNTDQLPRIARRLRENPEDRRSVLQMWSSTLDLDYNSKDLPCNLIATFQRDLEGRLDMVVFCRSNDIVWGCYGANAVHFSMLQEYMALAIGCAIGSYTQVSVNWHGYLNTLADVKDLPRPDKYNYVSNPYVLQEVVPVPMASDGGVSRIDELIDALLDDADSGFSGNSDGPDDLVEPWGSTVYHVLKAHHKWKDVGIDAALECLNYAPRQRADWIVAARQFLERRQAKARMKNVLEGQASHP